MIATTQIGPRLRRNRIAEMRKAAVIARPIHKPGLMKKWTGASVRVLIDLPSFMMASPSAPPVKRLPIKAPKWVVLKAALSAKPIARGGNAAHRIGALLAHADTNKSQPKMGACQSP